MATAHTERGILRILAARPGPAVPVGAGFLITKHYLLTCAHVVNESLGREAYAVDQPETPIFLDLAPGNAADTRAELSTSGTDEPLTARVHLWYPAHEQPQQNQPDDIAVLKFEQPRSAIHTLPLLRPDSAVPPGYQGYAYGFPERGNNGIWAKAELSGHQYFGWRQIDDLGGTAIDSGFSGCPFLDSEQQRVIGMVVARHNRFPISYLIPVETLFGAWSELTGLARQTDLPAPTSSPPSANTSANAQVEQHQNVNLNLNISVPAPQQSPPTPTKAPAAPEQESPPTSTTADGLPTITLRIDQIGDEIRVNALRPTRTPPRATSLVDLERAAVDMDHDALFRALFDSPFELQGLLSATGASTDSRDPTNQPLRLRLLCTDAKAATLPWHCLTHKDRRLGEVGWIIEVVDEPDGGTLPIALDNPLVIAPADPALASEIGARIHATGVRAHIRRLLADRRGPVEWASNRRELEVTLDREPDLIYVFARMTDGSCLILGKAAGQCESVDLQELSDRLARFEQRPLLWLHLVLGHGMLPNRDALLRLRRHARMLLIQSTTPATLERGLNNTLEWMSAMADGREEPAAVISRLGDTQGTHLWLRSHSVRLCPTPDGDAALIDYIRASLVRILLGRKTEKLLLFDGIKHAPGGSLLLYAVCGDEQSCTHDLPEQARQYIEALDRSIRIETRPIPFTMCSGASLFDDVARQLKQDLNISVGLPPEDALRLVPVVRPEDEDTLVIALSWLLDVTADFEPSACRDWISTWKQAIFAVLKDEIPDDYLVLVGACIQWPDGWPEHHGTNGADLPPQINQALRRDNPRPAVRSIEIDQPLGVLKESDLFELYRDSDPALRTRLGAGQLNLDDLVAYIEHETNFSFRETVQLIYTECKYHYTGFKDFLKGKAA